MMKRAFLLALLLLNSCASEPLTPEQRQMAFQYLMSRQQPQPYVLPMPAPMISQAPRTCQSNVNGQTIYTSCY